MIASIRFPVLALSLAAGAALACGGEKAATPETPAPPAEAAGGLTAFQTEHGIGPITEPVTLPSQADPAMASAGKSAFDTKCAACHAMGERLVGPPLGEVTARRTPAFVLNMILNPQEMVERHPVGKQLLAEYTAYMPNLGLTEGEARQILEYLRTQAKGVAQ